MMWQNLENFLPQFQSIFLIDWFLVGTEANTGYFPLTCWMFSGLIRAESDTNESGIMVVLS
jgi:hypothetical protein